MKKPVFTYAAVLLGCFFLFSTPMQGQLLLKANGPSNLYEHLKNPTTPRLLYPYNSSGFSTTEFLFELKVDGTQTTNGFRLSRASKDYVIELLKDGGYGIYQAGSSLSNYFGSNTAIGGSTVPFQPLTTLHVKGNGLFTDKLGIGALTAAPVTTLQVLGTGLITDKLGIGISSIPQTTLQVGGNGSVSGRLMIGPYTSVSQPQYPLQVKSADSVTVQFDAASGQNTVFYSTSTLGDFKFYATTQFEVNPDKALTRKVLVAEILHNGTLRSQTMESHLLTTGTVTTTALKLTGGVVNNGILQSDASGNAKWVNPEALFPAANLWQQNANNTIYTTAPGVAIGNYPPAEKFQVGQTFTFHDGPAMKAISYNYSPATSSTITTGAASSMVFENDGDIVFKHSASGAGLQGGLYLLKDGTVGIRTGLTGPYALAVNGVIGCKEIKVEVTSAAWNWPDYVFAPGYRLPSLAEVEQYVKEEGHLPGIPDALTINNNGLSIGEMQATLLKKIEELTLYLIDQQKTAATQQQTIESQREALAAQQEQINQLKALIQNR